MIIKIGDIIKWSGQEFVVIGNENNRVQVRPVGESVYDVKLEHVEEVVVEHSYGGGHVCA